MGLLSAVAGVIGVVAGMFLVWWVPLAAGLCALAAHLVMRHAASRMIGPATTPAMKRAKRELIRRLLSGDDELEAQVEAHVREHRDHDAAEGERRDAPDVDA